MPDLTATKLCIFYTGTLAPTVVSECLGGEDLPQLYNVRVVHLLPHVHNVHTLGVHQAETCKQQSRQSN